MRNLCLLSLALAAQLLLTSAQFDCKCTCCIGNFCTASYIGSFPVTACSGQCFPDACEDYFPRNCSAHTWGTISVADGCVPTNVPNPFYNSCAVKPNLESPWAGVYRIKTTGSTVCNPGTCGCCMNDILSVVQDGVLLTLSGTLTGSGCPSTFRFTTVVPRANNNTASVATTTIGGRYLSIAAAKDLCSTQVTVTYKDAPACNVVASRTTSSAFTSSSPSIWLLSISFVLYTMFVAK